MRARALGLLLCSLAAAPAPALAQAPSTDIWLVPLELGGGAPRLGLPLQMTRYQGYDNQPAFAPDGRNVFYTSSQYTADGSTNLFDYDIATRQSRHVTTSPESEYSPTPIPGSSDLASVVVERDSAQRLWRISRKNGKGQVLLERVKPVGYFAFADERTVAMYLLGTPSALAVADLRTGAVDTIARNIGRSIQKIPDQRAISFVQRGADSSLTIRRLDLGTRAVTDVAPVLAGSQDVAWTPDGRIFMAKGNALYQRRPGTEGDWELVMRFTEPGLQAITRLAVSPKGNYLALVSAEPGAPMAANPPRVTPPVIRPTPDRAAVVAPAAPPAAAKPDTTPAAKDMPAAAAPTPNPVIAPGTPPVPRPTPDRAQVVAPGAPVTLIVVRHAEKADTTRDPALSAAGEARARALAVALADAHVTGVITTPLQRTRATAAPLARALSLPMDTVGTGGGLAVHAANTVRLARERFGGGTVLIVGHSNTVPAILAAAGAPKLPDLCDSEYDALFIVTVPVSGASSLVRTRYGAPSADDPKCAATMPGMTKP